MRLAQLVSVSAQVAATRKRLEKRQLLATLLCDAGTDRVGLVVSYLSGRLPQGRVGLGPALLRNLGSGGAVDASLSLNDVDQWVDEFAAVAGKGAKGRRRDLLERLWSEATPEEAEFLYRLLLGELRQGALEGLLVDAIADAAGLPAKDVRRATMLAGSPVPVAVAALAEGADGIAAFRLTLLQPLQPMLAQPGELDALFAAADEHLLEYKLDGARVQVHRRGEEVRIFSRALHDVTASLPEVVEVVLSLPARELILDGEAIALRDDGLPHPFQVTMRRFGRRSDVERMRGELPLSIYLFDCLHVDGEDLIDRPLENRLASLDALALELSPPRLRTADAEAAARFLAGAFDAGHEGVMVKNLASPYAAGSRGADWQKIKQVHTLDLVVLAAEWGSGRRQGWLSNLHLGARDSAGGFVMLGKTFKGLTDEMLGWQTERLLALETGRDDYVVQVRPELVVEIAVNEIQKSPQYPAGMALRFARVKAYRDDKAAAEADTVETVRALFASRPGV
ncbi:MAG: ATP-dependent DNA ligase [Pseudomonadota bacterium]